MGIFNGFICDRCKREFKSDSKDYNPVTIQLRISFGRTTPTDYPNTTDHMIWCRKCLISTGFQIPTTEEDKKIAPEFKLTFEEKFSMMIEALGFIREE